MKYLKLYEAFESDIITETIKFLSKKIGKNKANIFKANLRNLKETYNIPISKMEDSDINYMSKPKALKIKADDIENDLGIYCIKYWFSIENGFLGKTGIVNNKFMRNFEGNESDMYSSGGKNGPFNNKELDYIKKNLGVKTGKLQQVKLSELEDN